MCPRFGVNQVAADRSAESILGDYPSLEAGDIEQALCDAVGTPLPVAVFLPPHSCISGAHRAADKAQACFR